MSRYETQSGQFGLVGTIRQDTSDLLLVSKVGSVFAPEARKGQLFIVADADGDAARKRDACDLVMRTIRKNFYDDSSYSVTSALRKAILAANQALYYQNFNASQQKRAIVGITCAVIKDGDVYLAQVAPAQAYILAEGKLRAFPLAPAWAGGSATAGVALKPRALGLSLTTEPEFYRAVLKPGDAALLCSSNFGKLLSREEVLRLLRLGSPDMIVDEIVAASRMHGLGDAHGLVLAICPPLSPAAQAAPFSPVGVSERGHMFARLASARFALFTGEIALLVKGNSARANREKADSRREQTRREEEQMTELPEERLESPQPPSVPPPLDVGESLAETIAVQRATRRPRLGTPPARSDAGEAPPSSYLGEGVYYPPVVERRIDLGDPPNGSGRARGNGAPFPPQTFGERLEQRLERLFGVFSKPSWQRRSGRPPPAMQQMRRQSGLSYRRQRPPFPWLLLLLLMSLTTLLVVYGRSLTIQNVQRQAADDLALAEQAVAAVRDAPDDTEAERRLTIAEESLGKVQASGIVTATLENRKRYEDAQREYERMQASIRKLTYFDDLDLLGSHPQAAAGSTFSDLVVPPPANGLTNTVGFSSIYALDGNNGVLYRMPRSGGAFEPYLKPSDSFAPGVSVGPVRAMAWRIDNIVAIAQAEGGPYIYYFRNNDAWNFSNIGGSEDWGQVTDKPLHLKTYEGNLYVWGAAAGQVLKYVSGRPGDLYDPWIKDDGGRKLETGTDIAVDGQIYVLQPDGHVLVFAVNSFEREITPPTVNPPLVTPTGFYVDGGPDSGSLFLVDTLKERIIQLDKKTGAFIQQIRARPDGPIRLDQLSALYVDDSGPRQVLYLVNGGQVLRATLPDPPSSLRVAGTPGPTIGTIPATPGTQPATDATPTLEP